MQVKGATVVITGASRGIGAALARRMHAAGASVGLLARSGGELEDLARSLGGARVATAVADVADRVQVDTAMASLRDALGEIDILVNNAGIGAYASVLEEDPGAYEHLMRVNYLGTVYATLAVLEPMAARRRGHIVNVASVAGRVGAPFEAAYSGSKFAVVGFTESLAAEMGELGVRVSMVNPGPVRTHFAEVRGVPFQRKVPRPLDPERVVDAIMRAVEKDRFEQVLPRWLHVANVTRALLPGLYHRGVLAATRTESAELAGRIDEKVVS